MFGYVGTKSSIGDARPMEVVRAVCANRGHVRPPAIGKHTGCLPCLLDLRDGRGGAALSAFGFADRCVTTPPRGLMWLISMTFPVGP